MIINLKNLKWKAVGWGRYEIKVFCDVTGIMVCKMNGQRKNHHLTPTFATAISAVPEMLDCLESIKAVAFDKLPEPEQKKLTEALEKAHKILED